MVTSTLTVQELFAATVPLANEIAVASATGEKVAVPQLLVEAFGGVATFMMPGEAGKVSVKFRPLTFTAFGLVKVKVKVETPLTLVGFGVKLFEMPTLEAAITLKPRPPGK